MRRQMHKKGKLEELRPLFSFLDFWVSPSSFLKGVLSFIFPNKTEM